MRLTGAPKLEVFDGRVRCGGDDWGPVIPTGSALSCCGCRLSFGRRDDHELCDCRCHGAHKFIFQPWF